MLRNGEYKEVCTFEAHQDNKRDTTNNPEIEVLEQQELENDLIRFTIGFNYTDA